jgi:hypothetical protein
LGKQGWGYVTFSSQIDGRVDLLQRLVIAFGKDENGRVPRGRVAFVEIALPPNLKTMRSVI